MHDSLYHHWYYSRPDLAAHILSLLVDGSGDPLSLIGERRIGKTSHLRSELVNEARSRKFLPIYIDIQQHRAKPLAAINECLQEAIDTLDVPATRLGNTLKTSVKKIGAASASIEFGDAPQRRRPGDPHLEVDWLVKETLRRARRPLLLIFDEIQELGSAPDGDNIVASLRSAITKSKEHLRVVFTGSSQIKLLEMFSRSRAALYEGASAMSFPVLGEAFLQFIAARCKQRFKRAPSVVELREAFERLQYRPRSLIDLVILHASSDTPNLLASLEHDLTRALSDRDFTAQWESLAGLHRAICLRIAERQDVSSMEARALYAKRAKPRRHEPVPPSTVAKALRALVSSHVVAHIGRGAYRIDDPLFAEWIRKLTATE
jgi:hypothetical protein